MGDVLKLDKPGWPVTKVASSSSWHSLTNLGWALCRLDVSDQLRQAELDDGCFWQCSRNHSTDNREREREGEGAGVERPVILFLIVSPCFEPCLGPRSLKL